ncbi:MAG: helicase SNF2, partial [Spiribacter salinus]
MAMAQKQFGHTWWGEQWLNALHAVDWSNRLPRGRRYANNGSVQSLRVDGRRVEARVKGSRRTPYKVSLEIPALPGAETEQLLDAIAADPALIGRLLNRELDPAVMEHAELLGVRIFPRDWRDLQMRCSCPDGASPCKHVAAVIYLIVREIDADPFQVFALRGLDLLGEMTRRGLDIGDDSRGALPDLVELLPAEADAETHHDAQAHAPGQPPRIDYTGLPSLLDALLRTLPADPGFNAASTVRKAWQTQMRRAMRRAKTALEALGGDAAEPSETHQPIAAQADPVVVLDFDGTIAVEGVDAVDDLGALLDWLADLGPAAFAAEAPGVAAWQTVRNAALHLIA